MSIISTLDLVGLLAAFFSCFFLFTPLRKNISKEEKVIIALACIITAVVNGYNFWSWFGEDATAIIQENWGDYLQILQPAIWGVFFYVVVQIAQRKELEESRRGLRSIIENMPVILQAFDDNGNILAWNKKAEEASGRSFEAIKKDRNALHKVFPNKTDREKLISECENSGGDYENRVRTMQGAHGLRKISWSNISKRFPIPGWSNWGVGLDITEQLMAQHELERMATYDELTQLPNRTLLRDRLQHALRSSKRNKQMGALLMLDLDHFKMVNDQYGHPVGDKLLQSVGDRISRRIKSTDTIARFSGDEFVILLDRIRDFGEAATIAERVLNCLSAPSFELNGNKVHINASIGITVFPDDNDCADELIKNMDLALYAAKESGRNSYQFYSKKMHKKLRQQHRISEQLRNAIEENKLTLHYQPQISILGERLSGAEALVRWPSFENGSMSPAVFVPIAENTGLMPAMGSWIIESAFSQAGKWKSNAVNFPIAINLSVLQFYQNNLLEFLDEKIEQYNITPSLIDFEITESAVMRNADSAIETMRSLNKRGFSISLDDFGTGYSSLSYLKKFPVNKLKIDQSFVKNLNTSKKDAAIVNAIIQLGHSLDLKVIAEGVETKSQLQKLGNSGCDEVQGFYYSKPLSAAEFDSYITSSKYERSMG